MSGDRYKINDQGALYFLTFTVIDWVDIFTRKEHKIILIDSLNYCVENKGLTIYAWCLMSNHIHLIAQAGAGKNMSGIIRDFKKFTAKAIINEINNGNESRKSWILNRMEFRGKYLKRIEKYKFWEDGSHAVELDYNNPDMIDQKLEYIHNNPVSAMIVEMPEHYLFSSARDYCGIKGLVNISLLS